MNQTPGGVTSPCTRNCCLDEGDVCLGCGRSLDEIRLWGQASDRERATILERAVLRRAERAARRRAWEAGNTK